MKQPVVLRIYKGDKLEIVRQFEHSQIVIGRGEDAQLVLQDEAIALLHAMIEDRGGDYYLSDLGSQTGTFTAGGRVLEARLNSGDEITVGPFRIQFFIGVPKPAAPPKPVATETVNVVIPPVIENIPVQPPAPVQQPTVSAPVQPAAPPPQVKAPQTPGAPPAAFEIPAPPALETSDAQMLAPKKPSAPPVKPAAQTTAPQAAAIIPPAKKVGHKAPTKTFAPASPYRDLKEIIKPHKGNVVEVLVAWKDRVLSTNHFHKQGSVFISSSEDADVVVPVVSSKSRYELIKIGTMAVVCLTPEMTGELVRENGESVPFVELARTNGMRNAGSHYEIDLKQGEMVRVGLVGDMVSVYIRYTADTPKPIVAPLLDMSSSEVTGVILALAVSAILGLYMNIYTPSPLLDDEAKIEEPIRKAVVTFTPPPPRAEPPKVEEVKEEKKVVEVKEKQSPQVAPKAQPQQAKAFEQKPDPGKAAEVKPKATKSNVVKPTSAVPQGASVKTGNKEGANMKAEKPDPKNMGLLATFGKGGVQKDLSKAYSGSGELAGMADAATGAAGSAENRAGDNLGGKLKDTGKGGAGTATYGIAGVGTQGRGTGTTGYGTGGLGQKGSVQINVGGQDAEMPGSMDKEAIRRVIREHIREIRNCYEKELQRSPDLYGKVQIEWDIEEEGRVGRAVVKSNDLGNNNVANCIVNRLKTWKFPDPPKDMVGRVVYPFVFSSQ